MRCESSWLRWSFCRCFIFGTRNTTAADYGTGWTAWDAPSPIACFDPDQIAIAEMHNAARRNMLAGRRRFRCRALKSLGVICVCTGRAMVQRNLLSP